ncbi:hypothetical protein DL769_007697 [Monosporascus sp. CRB-8-3]|nr:hypothetical protein DL769_007697 [Monosporascus sp. CRB-8-3]
MATAHEEPAYENPSIHSSVVKPIQDLLGLYDTRAKALQGVLDHLTKVEKERQHWQDDLNSVRGELEQVRLQLAEASAASEKARADAEEAARDRDEAVAGERRARESADAADRRAHELAREKAGAEAELALLRPFVLEGVANEVVRIHHVSWGPRAINDPATYQRLLDHAARGTEFQATNGLAGTDTRYGYAKSLKIAYSKPDRGPMKWIVVNEWEKARFDV